MQQRADALLFPEVVSCLQDLRNGPYNASVQVDVVCLVILMSLVERVGSAFSALVTDRKGGQQPQSEPSTSGRPDNVGILALEVYFPRLKVDQAELEAHDGVAPGKYTVGLGQRAMAFTGDQEDVVSMSLTVVQSLLEKYSIEPSQVGRLEVGTESSIDRSKSVKSFLMALFHQSGNSDVEGVDCVNACYGGTAALFNAVNWVESRSWDGRYAIVVAADVAIYASGPARASGGCGAVAMLIGLHSGTGEDAPLAMETGCSAAYMDDVYDFYKPAGIFPQVEGKLSIACYLTALDRCYARLCQKAERLQARRRSEPQGRFNLADVDFCVMHAPFAKMVRKGFARLVLQDCLRQRTASDVPATASDAPATASDAPATASDAPATASDASLQQTQHSKPVTEAQRPQPSVAVQANTTAKKLGGSAAEPLSAESDTAAAASRHPGSPGPGDSAAPDCADARLGFSLNPKSCSGSPRALHRALDELGDGAAENCEAARVGFSVNPEPYPGPLHRALDELGNSAAGNVEDKRLEQAALQASAADFEAKVAPGSLLGLECGNMYAASVHASLASLVYSVGSGLEGSRILVNSYGSGLAASLFCIQARPVTGRFSLASIAHKLDLDTRLAQRSKVAPAEFMATLDLLELMHGRAGHKPVGTPEELFPGTYYLQEVDERFRRKYARRV